MINLTLDHTARWRRPSQNDLKKKTAKYCDKQFENAVTVNVAESTEQMLMKPGE